MVRENGKNVIFSFFEKLYPKVIAEKLNMISNLMQ